MRIHTHRKPTQLDALAAIYSAVLLTAFVFALASIAVHAARFTRGKSSQMLVPGPVPAQVRTAAMRAIMASYAGENPEHLAALPSSLENSGTPATLQDAARGGLEAAKRPSSQPQREEGHNSI